LSRHIGLAEAWRMKERTRNRRLFGLLNKLRSSDILKWRRGLKTASLCFDARADLTRRRGRTTRFQASLQFRLPDNSGLAEVFLTRVAGLSPARL